MRQDGADTNTHIDTRLCVLVKVLNQMLRCRCDSHMITNVKINLNNDGKVLILHTVHHCREDVNCIFGRLLCPEIVIVAVPKSMFYTRYLRTSRT